MKNPFVLINIFTVTPDDQRRLIDLLTKATGETIKHMDGFITSTLHRSIDGTKVTMYAQWESREKYEAMRRNATASPYLEEALSFAKFEMGAYEVVEIFKKA
ncbi:antibiotic biosynthesis monooxygenase [Niastella yeongjuensis]|uniref:Antibiotic biosynthesis monooxygenase n=1 Tax=Niastella yeongjuensis TaxID=354355 RepID=A0A1V9DXS5_9BACT|nr:antibiotic biosynthesis monooxygenase family protein [Niastella yeongjuensis]OQP38640.1 antibiotic biosynthesis monooxygenase [Niastella yeongjuensis]SEO38444.1 Antibiotic biosynthesis monooxygenase [Niastella yeongjuensis]